MHEDLADIALALPGLLAAKIVPEVKAWIGARHKILLDENLGALAGKLVEEDEGDAALELAGKLLEVLPDPHPSWFPNRLGTSKKWSRPSPRIIRSADREKKDRSFP